VGFGTELLFIVALGLVVLGPKQLHIVLGYVARVKAEFDKASRGIKFQLAAQLEGAPQVKSDDEPLLLRATDGAEPDEPDSLAATSLWRNSKLDHKCA
jgi:Sec-independent protein translocase protein TatA